MIATGHVGELLKKFPYPSLGTASAARALDIYPYKNEGMKKWYRWARKTAGEGGGGGEPAKEEAQRFAWGAPRHMEYLCPYFRGRSEVGSPTRGRISMSKAH